MKVIVGPSLPELVVKIAEEMNIEPWQSYLTEAMDFVLRGEVNLDEGTVTSGSVAYTIHLQYGCDCPDHRIRKHCCKHMTALEMQKRIHARLKGEKMPRNNTPQDAWEAKAQGGEKDPDPDDVPDPVLPDSVQQMIAAGQKDEASPSIQPSSTLCIERHIGETKLTWTFEGSDADVWDRVRIALAKIKKAAEANERRGNI
jgi:hypothetical protein